MKIIDFLKPEMICIDMKARTKEDAIRELAELMKKSGEISNFQQYLTEVLERESIVSTGIGNELAIPHARTGTVNKILIVFGLSKNGIDFEASDNKPAKYIFLIAIPNTDVNRYFIVLSQLNNTFKNEALTRELNEAKTPEEVINAFKKS